MSTSVSWEACLRKILNQYRPQDGWIRLSDLLEREGYPKSRITILKALQEGHRLCHLILNEGDGKVVNFRICTKEEMQRRKDVLNDPPLCLEINPPQTPTIRGYEDEYPLWIKLENFSKDYITNLKIIIIHKNIELAKRVFAKFSSTDDGLFWLSIPKLYESFFDKEISIDLDQKPPTISDIYISISFGYNKEEFNNFLHLKKYIPNDKITLPKK